MKTEKQRSPEEMREWRESVEKALAKPRALIAFSDQGKRFEIGSSLQMSIGHKGYNVSYAKDGESLNEHLFGFPKFSDRKMLSQVYDLVLMDLSFGTKKRTISPAEKVWDLIEYFANEGYIGFMSYSSDLSLVKLARKRGIPVVLETSVNELEKLDSDFLVWRGTNKLVESIEHIKEKLKSKGKPIAGGFNSEATYSNAYLGYVYEIKF